VALNPDLIPQTFDANGHYTLPNPPLPLLKNYLYALTAMNDQEEKSDTRVFEMFQKLGVARPSIAVGRAPAGIALSPDGSRAFVTNSDDNSVSVIEVNLSADPSFGALPTPVATGINPGSIAVTREGKYVFVANGESNTVTVFSGTPPFQLFAVEVSGGNEGRLAVAQDGRVFVPKKTRDSAAISVIDTADAPSFKVLADLKLADSTVEITGVATYAYADGVYVFASDPNHYQRPGLLWIVGPESVNPPFTLNVGQAPGAIAISPDGHYVFVANYLEKSVSVIEVSSGPKFQVLSSLDAGNNPAGLAVSPDGRFLFVTNDDGLSVWGIDKNSAPPVKLLQTVGAGEQSRGIAVLPKDPFILVADWFHNSVSVIEPVAVSM
jgi:DNA-binding beta-propeller fold protein YncE